MNLKTIMSGKCERKNKIVRKHQRKRIFMKRKYKRKIAEIVRIKYERKNIFMIKRSKERKHLREESTKERKQLWEERRNLLKESTKEWR